MLLAASIQSTEREMKRFKNKTVLYRSPPSRLLLGHPLLPEDVHFSTLDRKQLVSVTRLLICTYLDNLVIPHFDGVICDDLVESIFDLPIG